MAKRKATTKQRRQPQAEKAPSGELTRPQLAKAFGVTPGTITRWERDGMPVATRATRGKFSKFNFDAVKKWREAQDTLPGQTATFALSKSRAILADKQVEKLDLELSLKRGDMVPRDQVIREGHAFGRAIQAKLRSLPRRAEHAGLIQSAQVAGLESLIREICTEISLWKTFGDLTKETKGAA